MLRGLTKLTWIEIKVFMREPLGAIGSIVIPVLVFMVLGRVANFKTAPPSSVVSGFSGSGLPALVAMLIAINAVLSLVTILKRLRATPLRAQTILTAHVLVKLILTAATVALMLLAGMRYFPPGVHVPWLSFTLALLIATCSILSIGFLIASMVPTARFAQPIGAIVLYPMLGLSGLFVPIAYLPPALRLVAQALPVTYAVHLLEGIWNGDAWSAHLGDLAALTIGFLVFTALSAKVFRWE